MERTAEHIMLSSDPMLPGLFRIGHIRKETHDTFTWELLPEDLPDGFGFLPGQFNMLYAFGVGEIPVSISGDPAETGKLVHTIRVVGTVTKAMQKLKTGDVLGVRGPFGNSWPVDQAVGKDAIIVAGGIGLAPLMPVLYSILSHRERYGEVALLYGARTPDDILFGKALERWRAASGLQVYITVDRSTAKWKGDVGVVTRLIKKARIDPANTIAVTCGPEIMMRFTGIELEKQGIPEDRIYLSMERNMECAIGLCGHCQLGPRFICKDGPIFSYAAMYPFLIRRET